LHPKQQEFYDDDRWEILYGGAAGGGKSVAQLASALKYVHVPGYAALLLRRHYSHLTMAGGLIPMSREWLAGRAHYNQSTHTWTFPSGATLSFGYLDHPRHLDRYQGGAWQYIGVDEITQFSEGLVRYLFSRLRKDVELDVPLRFRGSGNPGGIGHEWVKRRWIDPGETAKTKFIPAMLEDNPSLDRVKYIQSLMELDPLTRARLLNGDWEMLPEGGMFKREWFDGNILDSDSLLIKLRWIRFWDRAATVPREGTDPDWTVGALVAMQKGIWYVKDIQRFRESPEGNERRIRAVSDADGSFVHVYMEQEPGSAGVDVISHYARNIMHGRTFRGSRPTGNKSERAAPVASAAEQGNLKLVEGLWINAFIDEATSFPMGPHLDQIDAVSGAFGVINARPRVIRSGRVVGL
jgi:predicted phage terminase large subunit-like protein